MNMKGTLEEILKALPKGVEVLKAEGLDSAVVGINGGRLVYSKAKCVDALVERDGMTEEDADEFLHFNTYCAYVGPMTPIYSR